MASSSPGAAAEAAAEAAADAEVAVVAAAVADAPGAAAEAAAYPGVLAAGRARASIILTYALWPGSTGSTRPTRLSRHRRVAGSPTAMRGRSRIMKAEQFAKLQAY